MFIIKVLLSVLLTTPFSSANDISDAHKSFAEIAVQNGFNFEQHTVTTIDGYILTQFRIPSNGPPIFFQHGILDSANAWIMNYADVAPAFVAARAGYDVWLGNSRGNTYSCKNIHYDPWLNEAKFWDFDWTDMGLKDLPASFDYITLKTGYQKIAYIGHSQGTTQMFYGLSHNQDYFKEKVSIFIALAPVTKISHTQAAIFEWLLLFYDQFEDALITLGIHSLLNNTWYNSEAEKLFCGLLSTPCKLIEKIFVNKNPNLDDSDRYQVYLGHLPNGVSTKSLLHYAQNLKVDRFQEWAPDYHHFLDIGNKRITENIPLQNITAVPIAMFVGDSDILADQQDAEWTRDMIGESVKHFQVINGGHESFLIGKDMSWFTNDVMNIVQQYHSLIRSDKEYEPFSNETSWLQRIRSIKYIGKAVNAII